MTSVRLVCAGSLTVDNVVTADGRLLPPMFGGNVVYAGLGARLWHDRVGLLSRVGQGYSRDYLRLLADHGLELGGVVEVDAPHGMNVAFRYEPDGSRTRKFTPAMLAELPESERARMIDYSAFDQSYRYAVWSAFTPDGNDVPDEWLADLAGLHCAAMPVARHVDIARQLNALPAPRPWLQVDSPWYDDRDFGIDHASTLLPLIDALLPSESDISLTGNPRELDGLRRLGRLTVIKRGGSGSEIFWRDGRRQRIPVLSGLDVVDFTGAGDAFCGGFLAGMHRTGDPVYAALFGTVSASFAIEAAGIEGLLAARRGVAEARLDRLKTILFPLISMEG